MMLGVWNVSDCLIPKLTAASGEKVGAEGAMPYFNPASFPMEAAHPRWMFSPGAIHSLVACLGTIKIAEGSQATAPLPLVSGMKDDQTSRFL